MYKFFFEYLSFSTKIDLRMTKKRFNKVICQKEFDVLYSETRISLM